MAISFHPGDIRLFLLALEPSRCPISIYFITILIINQLRPYLIEIWKKNIWALFSCTKNASRNTFFFFLMWISVPMHEIQYKLSPGCRIEKPDAAKMVPCLAFSPIKIIYELSLWTSGRGLPRRPDSFLPRWCLPLAISISTFFLTVALKYHEEGLCRSLDTSASLFDYLKTTPGEGWSEHEISCRVEAWAGFSSLRTLFRNWNWESAAQSHHLDHTSLKR